MLTDFAAYPDWNPFVVAASGRPEQGARLRIRVAAQGYAPTPFRPRVLVAEPDRELRWLGRILLPGLYDAEHFMRLDPLPGGRTLFRNGEILTGLSIPLVRRLPLYPAIVAGFEAMNAALNARVEGGGAAA